MSTSRPIPTPPVAPLPHGIPTYGFNRGRYAWPRGGAPVLHLFRDWDVFLVESGEATWTFTDGRRAVARAGDLALLPPLVPAYVSETGGGLVFRYCHVGFRDPAALAPARLPAFAGPGAAARVPLAIRGRAAPAAVEAYRELASVADDDAHPPWRVERAVIALIAAIADHASAAASRGEVITGTATVDPRVEAAQRRLADAPARAWRVTELARLVGCTPNRLNALFRAAVGHGIKRAIVDARLRRALRLLLDRPRASVREIAEASGFSSQHFFSRQFRGRYGAPPLPYRRAALSAPG